MFDDIIKKRIIEIRLTKNGSRIHVTEDELKDDKMIELIRKGLKAPRMK
jgi:hypothetical protein